MSNLDGTAWYWKPSVTNTVTENLVSFVRYGLLELGAFFNIYKDQVNINGVNQSILRPVDVPGASGFRVFRGLRKDWVWEQNISLKSTGSQPVVPSGIYVNDVFFPEGTAVSGRSWHFDFPQGCVVFSSGVPSGWVLKCDYCVRLVSTYRVESQQYKKLTTDWLQRNQASGTVEYSAEELAYLPAIFVGLNGYRTVRGTEIGSRAKHAAGQVTFNIFSVSPWDSRQLTDILYFLETKTVQLYNTETAPKALNSSGSIVNSSYTWPHAISGYLLGISRFNENASVQYSTDTVLPVFHSKVSLGLEFDIYPL